MSAEERARLCDISRDVKYVATLLPIRTVGVQGDGRTYSYAVGISTDNVKRRFCSPKQLKKKT